MTDGALQNAAGLAARALLAEGATALQAKLGAYVASFGRNCWRTYARIRDDIRRGDGKPYHRESIARAGRLMAQAGWIEKTRVHVGEQPTGARYSSSHGTTNKFFRWQRFGIKSPIKAREARKLADVNQERSPALVLSEAPDVRRRAARLQTPEQASAGSVAASRELPPQAGRVLPAGIAEAAAKVAAAYERRWAAAEERDLENVAAVIRERGGRDPPPT